MENTARSRRQSEAVIEQLSRTLSACVRGSREAVLLSHSARVESSSSPISPSWVEKSCERRLKRFGSALRFCKGRQEGSRPRESVCGALRQRTPHI